MALRRLTSLEAGKLEAEAKELATRIAELQVRCTFGGAATGWLRLRLNWKHSRKSHVALRGRVLVLAAIICRISCLSPCCICSSGCGGRG